MNLVEIVEVNRAEFEPAILYGQSIDLPGNGHTKNVFSFTVAGWVLGNSTDAVVVEFLLDEFLVKTARLYMPRPDVANHFPGIKNAGSCGFWTDIGVLGLGEDFELTLKVVLKDQTRLPLGNIKVRRKPISTEFTGQF